ncbi:hypothetical protein, partial [Mycoplasma enhydrae]|uniref:hypothetical protein n=1 Tax=Mycoplasma enhydrae TaxID=2499220 RepID=UPI00197C3BFC
KQTHDTAYQNWKNTELKNAKKAADESGNSIEKIEGAISAYESALVKLEAIKTAANAQEYHANDGSMNQNKTEIETALVELRAKLQSEQHKEDKRVESLKKLLQDHIDAITNAQADTEAQKETIDPLDQNLGALVNIISNARRVYNANKDDKNPEAQQLAKQLGELIGSANTNAGELLEKLNQNKADYQRQYNKALQAFNEAKTNYAADKNSNNKAKYEALMLQFDSVIAEAQKSLDKATSYIYNQGTTESRQIIDDTKIMKESIDSKLKFETTRQEYLDMLNNPNSEPVNDNLYYIFREERNGYEGRIQALNVDNHTIQDMKNIINEAKNESKRIYEKLKDFAEKMNHNLQYDIHKLTEKTKAPLINLLGATDALKFFEKFNLEVAHFNIFFIDGFNEPPIEPKYIFDKLKTSIWAHISSLEYIEAEVNPKYNTAKAWIAFFEKANYFLEEIEKISNWGNIGILDIPAEYKKFFNLPSPIQSYFNLEKDYKTVLKVFEGMFSTNHEFFFNVGQIKIDNNSHIYELINKLDQILIDKPFYKLKTKAEYENALKPYANKQKEILQQINRITVEEITKLDVKIVDESKYKNNIFNPFIDRFKAAINPVELDKLHKEIVIDREIDILIQKLADTINNSLVIANELKQNNLPSEYGKNKLFTETKLQQPLPHGYNFEIVDHSPNDKTGIIKIKYRIIKAVDGLEYNKTFEQEISGFKQRSQENIKYTPFYPVKWTGYTRSEWIEDFAAGRISKELIDKLFTAVNKKDNSLEINTSLYEDYEFYNFRKNSNEISFTFSRKRIIIGKDNSGYIYENQNHKQEFKVDINRWKTILRRINDYWIMYWLYNGRTINNQKRNQFRDKWARVYKQNSNYLFDHTYQWEYAFTQLINNEVNEFQNFFENHVKNNDNKNFETDINIRMIEEVRNQVMSAKFEVYYFENPFKHWLKNTKKYKGRLW